MHTKKTPAPVASGAGAGSGRRDDTRDHSKNDANALAVACCDHCGWYVPRGSATEKLHHQRCVVPHRRRIDRLKAWDRAQRWKRVKRLMKVRP